MKIETYIDSLGVAKKGKRYHFLFTKKLRTRCLLTDREILWNFRGGEPCVF